MALQHLRSSTANKRPLATALSDGQLAVNTEATSPGLFFKNASGSLVKVGPVHVGATAPNASPASGGEAGNTVGEQWLDTSGTNPILKVWDGSGWASEVGEFVNASGDTMTGALVMDNQQQVRFRETTANGTNFIAIQAPASVAADRTLTLPDATGTLVSTGDTGSVTSAMIANGTIVDADINASATIAGSKIQAASTSNAGAVQLTDSTSSTSTTTAATPNSVKSAYDLANAALPKAGGALTGDVTLNAQSDLRFADSDSSNWVALQGPATVASNVTWTLPNADGTTGQVLSTDGAGALSWTSAAGGAGDKIEEGNTSAEVIDTGSDGRFVVTTEGTERARIDSSGRLLVGTTTDPTVGTFASARFSLKQSTDSGIGAGFQVEASGDTSLLWCGYNGTSFDFGTSYRTTGGIKPITFSVGATERCRIDSSGRLLVGTSSSRNVVIGISTGWAAQNQIASTSTNNIGLSLFSWSNYAIDVGGGAGVGPDIVFARSNSNTEGTQAAVTNGMLLGRINFNGSDGTAFANGAYISAASDGQTWASGDCPTRLVFSTTADGASSPTERMRISNAGQTDVFSGGGGVVSRTSATAGTTVSTFVGIHSATSTGTGTVSFIVWSNGNAVNTNNSYGSISDIKLKENIVDADSQWADLKALQVRKYNFKKETGQQTHTQIGLIAQEVELVSPGLVSESPDRDAEGNDLGTVTKSVNYSVFYMKAVKALQEAMERIETLEAKVAALEAQ